MSQLPIDLHVNPTGPGRQGSGEAAGDDRDADTFLRADAERLGYLSDGRGFARYLRDFGILPARYLDENVRAKEITGLDLSRLNAGQSTQDD